MEKELGNRGVREVQGDGSVYAITFVNIVKERKAGPCPCCRLWVSGVSSFLPGLLSQGGSSAWRDHRARRADLFLVLCFVNLCRLQKWNIAVVISMMLRERIFQACFMLILHLPQKLFIVIMWLKILYVAQKRFYWYVILYYCSVFYSDV